MVNFIDIITLINNVFFVSSSVLLNKLSSPFTKFEKLLLIRIASQLNETSGQTLLEHMSSINYVQRDGDDRQIRMYKFRPFYYNWDRSNYFFNRKPGESRICKFVINFDDGEKLHGALKAVDGVFVAVDFGANAKRYRNAPEFSVKITSEPRNN